MSKTEKQEQPSSGQEPSTQSPETQPGTEKLSLSSTSGSLPKELNTLICKYCGSNHEWVVREGQISHCAACDTSAHWLYKADADLAKKYVEYFSGMKKTAPHKDTPACEALDRGLRCGSHQWAHDGKELLYCLSCGTNYRGPQPKNVAEIIKKLGQPVKQLTEPLRHPMSKEQLEKAKKQMLADSE